MKQLRVLTGAHAGAQLRLSRQSHVVGAGSEADVEITDWNLPSIRLLLQPDGPVLVQGLDEAMDEGQPLADLAPRRFGDVVLCVGPADAAWPSDIDLLEKMVKAPPAFPVQAPSKPDEDALRARSDEAGRRWTLPGSLSKSRPAMLAAGLASVALLSVFVSVVSHLGPASASAPQRPLSARVAQAIEATGVSGVTALPDANGGVVVEGTVIDGSSAAKLRAALLPFNAERVAHHFSTASDISQSIADALGNPGLQVSYEGSGVFRITGSSVDMDGVRDKLRRIATDLGPAVKRIDVAAADLPPPSTLPAGAVLSTGTLEYVQTRDGTKHTVLLVPPDEAASAAAAAPHVEPALRHAAKRFASRPRAHKQPPYP